MKKTFYIFYFLTIGLIFNACQDAYEIEPDFLLTEESTVKTVDDLERLLLGTYDGALGFQSAMLANMYPSDNLVIGGGNAGQGTFGIQWQYTSAPVGSISDGIWNSAYGNFYSVNRIINKAQSITVEAGEEDKLNGIVGEAHAIRAYSLFELVRFYSPTYEASSPSGYMITEALDFDANNILPFPRNTVGELITQIQSDLDMAESLIASQNDINRFTIPAINALKARMGIFINTNASLTEVVQLTTDLLAQYPLADTDDYTKMFREDLDASEVIFKIERDLTDGYIGRNFRAGNGDIYVSLSNDFESLLVGTDVRREVMLDTETEITPQSVSTEGEFVVGKYIGRDDNFDGLQDHIIFRSSEMLLLRAEANARLNQLPEAKQDIEDLRTERSSVRTTPDYADIDEALDDILLERRIELAFEGHRFLDLKRFGKPVSRSDADATLNRGAKTLPAGNFRFTFPIPQAEIDRNDGISNEDQNPGYNN